MVREVYITRYKRRKPGQTTKTVSVSGYDKTIRGPASKTVPPDNSIFKIPRKSRKLAKIVRLDTYENAQEAADELLKEFKRAKAKGQMARARHIKRATVSAANHAKIMSKNPRLRPETRRAKDKIRGTYVRSYRKMRLH